jgi:hypothetical protein
MTFRLFENRILRAIHAPHIFRRKGIGKLRKVTSTPEGRRELHKRLVVHFGEIPEKSDDSFWSWLADHWDEILQIVLAILAILGTTDANPSVGQDVASTVRPEVARSDGDLRCTKHPRKSNPNSF